MWGSRFTLLCMPHKTFTLSACLAAACLAAAAVPIVAMIAMPAPATTRPAEVDLVRVAGLRAQGPAGLREILDEYDRSPSAVREDMVDLVAAQKHAIVSRLYWYTDRAAAIAAAQQRHVPILELRLLGRLDEELSCANSRLFRAAVYANTEVSAFLRQNFVLLWTTERPVPKVTIDFGDGRAIHTTVTGNSAHFVLDERGAVIDLLPGMYAPAAFRAELATSLGFARSLDPERAAHRAAQVRAYHADRAAAARAQWDDYRKPWYGTMLTSLLENPPKSAVAAAQERTITKAYIEVPQLRGYLPDPGSLADDEAAVWARIAELTWGLTSTDVLDRASTELLVDLRMGGPRQPNRLGRDDQFRRFEQHLLADSGLAQFKLRTQIHDYLATHDSTYLPLDRYLYAEVFKTPSTDPWLGLWPATDVTGLAGDGATAP